MIGTDFQEFYEKLYYGADIEIKYDKSYYMIFCCGHKNGEHEISVEKSNYSFYENTDHDDFKITELFKVRSKNTKANIEKFLNAKIFENKSFLEAEKDIKVLSY